MQTKREIKRNTGTGAAKKPLQYAQDLTRELIKDLGGLEDPKLSTILEGDEDSNHEKFTDSTQMDLENISRNLMNSPTLLFITKS